MPRFHFHLACEDSYSPDDEGIVFDDLDDAYLEACRAVLDMSFDMLRERRDPHGHRFEIADDAGLVLLDLPFTEVLRPRRPLPGPVPSATLHSVVKSGMRRNKLLRADVIHAISAARETLEQTRKLLAR